MDEAQRSEALRALRGEQGAGAATPHGAALRASHSELMKWYTRIEAMVLKGQHRHITAALHAFRSKFERHVLEEDLHFYEYLERCLGHNFTATLEKVNRDLARTSREVFRFLDKYQGRRIDQSNVAAFFAEFELIGVLLLFRFRRESQIGARRAAA